MRRLVVSSCAYVPARIRRDTFVSYTFSTSVSLIIWYLLNVALVQPRQQHRFECSRALVQGGRRVAPEKRKCVGGLRGREGERREGERVVGADGVRDNTHGTDERVCFWRALFPIAERFEKDKQLKKTKAQTAREHANEEREIDNSVTRFCIFLDLLSAWNEDRWTGRERRVEDRRIGSIATRIRGNLEGDRGSKRSRE